MKAVVAMGARDGSELHKGELVRSNRMELKEIAGENWGITSQEKQESRCLSWNWTRQKPWEHSWVTVGARVNSLHVLKICFATTRPNNLNKQILTQSHDCWGFNTNYCETCDTVERLSNTEVPAHVKCTFKIKADRLFKTWSLLLLHFTETMKTDWLTRLCLVSIYWLSDAANNVGKDFFHKSY